MGSVSLCAAFELAVTDGDGVSPWHFVVGGSAERVTHDPVNTDAMQTHVGQKRLNHTQFF